MNMGNTLSLLATLAFCGGCLINTDLYEQRRAEILAEQPGGPWGVRLYQRPDCINIDVGGLSLDGPWTFEAYLWPNQPVGAGPFPVVVWPGVFAFLQDEYGYLVAAPASNPVAEAGASTPTSLLDGGHHHVALNYNLSRQGELSLYLDGALKSQAPVVLDQTPGDTLQLGCWSDRGLTFQGLIAEVRLSGAALYAGAFEPSWEPYEVDQATLGLWHLDEGMGAEILDETESYPGTLSGGVWERFSLRPE